jgi:hypothetical protein
VSFVLLRVDAQQQPYSDDYGSWVATGTAFRAQPVPASTVLTDRFAPVRLGGDYWRGLPYPLGQRGKTVIATAVPDGNGPTGTLTSPRFVLDAARPYFSVLIGGTNDIARERIEVQVQPLPTDGSDFERQVSQWHTASRACALPNVTQDEGYLTLLSLTGAGYEQLRHEVMPLPAFVLGHQARIKLVDDSASGHLNIDNIEFLPSAPAPRPTPVWGYADYHTHPMSHLAFGGLKGMRTIWGIPGGKYEDYVHNPSLVNKDLPRCATGHGGGPFAKPFLNAAQKLEYERRSIPSGCRMARVARQPSTTSHHFMPAHTSRCTSPRSDAITRAASASWSPSPPIILERNTSCRESRTATFLS